MSSRTVVRSAASGDDGKYDFDLFTIGAGTGGVRASRFAANYGDHFHALSRLPNL